MTFPIGSLQTDSAENPGDASSRKPRGKKTPARAASVSSQMLSTIADHPERSRRWGLVLGAVLWVLVVLAFVTHSPQDAAFSTSGLGRGISNKAGAFGAWMSDLAFFLFGRSAWWLPVASLHVWLKSCVQVANDEWLRRQTLKNFTPDSPLPSIEKKQFAFDWGWLLIGLLLVLCASTALEYSRLYRWEWSRPGLQAGGVLGDLLGRFSVKLLGLVGSGLVWITCLIVGISWAFQFSWVKLAEKIGSWLSRLRQKRTCLAPIPIEEIPPDSMQKKLASSVKTMVDRVVAPAKKQFSMPKGEGMPKDIDAMGMEPTSIVGVGLPKIEKFPKEHQRPLFSDLPDKTGRKLPQVDLLDSAPTRIEASVTSETLEMISRLIEKKLKDFGVQVQVIAASPGPVITRYEIEPATGVKGSQIVNLAKDLARSLSLVSIRVVETIPGKNLMALELPNAKRQVIRLAEILGSQAYADAASMLTMGLGKDIIGSPVVADLAKMPHCLVAGTTGSGKSVGINAMILSLLYKAEAKDVRLILIDPKMLEMSVYEGIPHLLCPVVTDMKQAANALNWGVGEMERRYKLMSKMGVRNLAGYNKKLEEAAERGESLPNPFSLTPEEPEPLERLPYIVIVIDELADLMMVVGKKIEELIARLAQKARAAGIHLVLATQRPSVDVITGLIKANIPTRIAFQVSSKIDSRTILDQMGAEALLGIGDMLYMPSGSGYPVRVHGAFVSDDEVHRVVQYLKSQGGPNYIEGILEGGTLDGEGNDAGGGLIDEAEEADPMYDQAVGIVLQHRRASISLVQRHLRIGYNRAARLLEQMEKAGMVSGMGNNGNRDILVPERAVE
jgi:S-DNA-T family DNA segregation ATPase FtsK/SpoIIIE